MLFFFANGRLGNQIFQYLFVKSLQTNEEKLFLAGFENLKETFELDFFNISHSNRFLRIIFYKILGKPILEWLANKKIISSIKVHKKQIPFQNTFYSRETKNYIYKKGLLKTITYIFPAYYMYLPLPEEDIFRLLKIRPKHIQKAQSILLEKNINLNTKNIFIHYRQGDMQNYYVLGKPAIIPIDWYRERIKELIQKNEKTVFIILSDEINTAKQDFSFVPNKIFINNNYCVDFAIMSCCDEAIIGASTMAWWGAFFTKKHKNIIAPKYFLGYNSKLAVPNKIVANFYTTR